MIQAPGSSDSLFTMITPTRPGGEEEVQAPAAKGSWCSRFTLAALPRDGGDGGG